ncbi:MAG: glycosyltransferase family 2 protein [Gaiellaceae bacterium]
MNWAPIVLFTYDRPVHTRQTLDALSSNEGARESDLLVYSDGPKTADREESVRAVRDCLRSVAGFKSVTVVEREENLGLANSVIAGVTETLQSSPLVIVMEDDLLTSTDFLAFVNAALDTYENRPDIFSVTGYNYPLEIPSTYGEDAYLSYRSSSWGWGTWQDRWSQVDWSVADYDAFERDAQAQELFRRGGDDLPQMLELQMSGKLDSWSIRFDYAHYRHDAFCLHPVISKVQNIGFDGSGAHCGDDSDGYHVELDPGNRPFRLDADLTIDSSVLRAFDRKFRPGKAAALRSSGLRRGKRIMKRLVPFAS